MIAFKSSIMFVDSRLKFLNCTDPNNEIIFSLFEARHMNPADKCIKGWSE